MLQITTNSTTGEILTGIKKLREQKGKEKETLELVNNALSMGYDFVISLFWEEALTYQHLYMNNAGNKEYLIKMEQVIYKAKFYIDKYKLKKWYSRLFRFMGRISDYKKQYKKSTLYYKKAIHFILHDAEPFRVLELNAFLSNSLILSGKSRIGLALFKKTFEDFEKGEGRKLKKSDYNTWAIWKSGLVIRTVESLLAKKLTYNRNLISELISQTEKDLDGGEFSYRLAELNALKKRFVAN